MDATCAGAGGINLPGVINSPVLKEKEIPANKERESPGDSFFKSIKTLGKKIDDYTKPRPIIEDGVIVSDTSGNRASSSVIDALKSGAISSFFTSGPLGIPAGAIGSAVGVKAGEGTGSLPVALIAGSVTSAAIGALLAISIMGPVGAGMFAVTSAFNGAIGTLYGSSKAGTRDGVCGGALIGAVTQGTAGALIGSVASGIGGSAVDGMGRAVLGAVTGAIIGGAVGAIAGPLGIIPGALKGGIMGGAGAFIGPRLEQGMRNLGRGLLDYLDRKILPRTEGIKAKRWQKIALGAVAGMLPTGFIGAILFKSPVGLAVSAALGGLMGAKAIYKSMKKPESPAEKPDTSIKQS